VAVAAEAALAALTATARRAQTFRSCECFESSISDERSAFSFAPSSGLRSYSVENKKPSTSSPSITSRADLTRCHCGLLLLRPRLTLKGDSLVFRLAIDGALVFLLLHRSSIVQVLHPTGKDHHSDAHSPLSQQISIKRLTLYSMFFTSKFTP
jgi:hypothetical protein